MVFQTKQVVLSKFTNLFPIIINKKVNNLNISNIIISKEKTISILIFLKINYLLSIMEGKGI